MTLLARRVSFADLPTGNKVVVKACGIMRADHALAAALHGADMIGLVFAKSRRTVTVETAQSIRHTLDGLERKPLLVGVFVNESPEAVLALAERVGLDVVQLSGDETPQDVAECASRYPVLKAMRFPQDTPIEAALDSIRPYRALVQSARLRFLVDTYHPGEYGGTGKLADWGVASEIARHEEIMLAGGLTPRNVPSALKEVAPWGVDVSSGIETAGVKDSALIKEFIVMTTDDGRPMAD